MSASDDRGAHRVRARDGFSLIELLIVIVIAGALMAMMFSSFQSGSAERSALAARDTYIWMARRARAVAVQRGITVQLRVAPTANRIVVARTSPDSLIEQRYVRKDFGTLVTTGSGDSVMICYNPRGFGNGCSVTTLPTTVTFTARAKSATAAVQALGTVEAK